MRLYDPNLGKITIGDVDIKTVNPRELRDNIGVVFQETYLFSGSIYDNIAYARADASYDEVIAAAKAANAHEFITKGNHAEGYDSECGENGCRLSGGEKQRLIIARAILRNPPILLLDEATSALDTVTERMVQNALNKAMENRTVFAIAHRLATIRHADKILVIQKGTIAEAGDHDSLMAANGIYRHLYDTQFTK
jgi:subfamily B ATP-binding cassette protein MsbA